MTIPSPLLRAVYEEGECIYLWPAAITFIVLPQHCDEHTSALVGLYASDKDSLSTEALEPAVTLELPF